MTIELRNTFLHVNWHDENGNDFKRFRRARSTPPYACFDVMSSPTGFSAAVHQKTRDDDTPPGAQCSTQASECSHIKRDTELHCTSVHEADSGTDSGQETDTGVDESVCVGAELACGQNEVGVKEADSAAQKVVAFEDMCQTVVDIWASLGALEAQFQNTYSTPPPAAAKAVDQNPHSKSEVVVDIWTTLSALEAQFQNTYSTPPPAAANAVDQNPHSKSEVVVDIWTTLSALEAQVQNTCSTPSPATAKAVDRNPHSRSAVGKLLQKNACLVTNSTTPVAKKGIQTLNLPTSIDVNTPVSRRTAVPIRSKTSLDRRAQPLKAVAPPSEMDNVLVATKQILEANSCVAAVSVSTNAGADVSNIMIQPAKLWRSNWGSRNVLAIAKDALMEASGASKNIYIVGYEADPFEDHSYGSGFSTALSLVPDAWQTSACWETYQRGHCPRGAKCRWKHPGRRQTRAVSVIIG